MYDDVRGCTIIVNINNPDFFLYLYPLTFYEIAIYGKFKEMTPDPSS